MYVNKCPNLSVPELNITKEDVTDINYTVVPSWSNILFKDVNTSTDVIDINYTVVDINNTLPVSIQHCTDCVSSFYKDSDDTDNNKTI